MKRTALFITALVLALPLQAKAVSDQPPQPQVKTTVKVDAATVELLSQLASGRAPSLDYWNAVAQCETASNWSNSGKWGGGLGIYNVGTFNSEIRGTWERWGGEQFASRPQHATRIEQIVVANRIAVFGFQTWKHINPKVAKQKGVPATYWYDKQATGFYGWGCIRNQVGNPCGLLANRKKGTWRPSKSRGGWKYYKANCKTK